MTTLGAPGQVSKADERVAAIGTADELIATLRLAQSAACCSVLRGKLCRVAQTVEKLMHGISYPREKKYTVSQEELSFLDTEIEKMQATLGNPDPEAGKGETALRLNAARTVARRAERALVAAERRAPVSEPSKAYLNRLSDFLGNAAAVADSADAAAKNKGRDAGMGAILPVSAPKPVPFAVEGESAIVDAVLSRLGVSPVLNLQKAKLLIEQIESYAASLGKKAVIAICNAEGNPIAVHVMDGAFLVSYEVAMKKAYTAVALKMSTMELSALVQPGQTFYGLQNMDRIVVFGGGVPLKVGETIVGGLGISGGTGEEDHAICEYALEIFASLQ